MEVCLMKNIEVDYIKDRIRQIFAKKQMRFTLYIVAVLWLAVITQVGVNKIFTNGLKITEAFVKTKTEDMKSSIEVIAEYSNVFLSEDDKKNVIQQISDAIGLTIDGDIDVWKEDNRIEYSYYKKAKNATSEIKVVSMELQQDNAVKIQHYIFVRISVLKSINSIDKYKEIIEDSMKKLGVNSAQTTMEYAGYYTGELSLERKQEIAYLLVDELQGEIAQEYDEGDLYTVYGFTGLLNDYVVSAGQKVNIQVAITYNEISDKTIVYLATPILNGSW